MKQLHKQSSTNHRRDEEVPTSSTPPYSPKSLKHPRSLPRSLNYLLKEQRLLFIIVGIIIASTFFILQPSLSSLNPSSGHPQPTSRLTVNYESEDTGLSSYSATPVKNSEFNSASGGNNNKGTGRVPVGIGRKRMRIVVTGGAGFVGSHLVDKLIARGDDVIVIDNFFTGRRENVMHHFGNPRFELIRHDVVEPILLEVDQIYHLACPASPVHYKYNPIKTIISFENFHQLLIDFYVMKLLSSLIPVSLLLFLFVFFVFLVIRNHLKYLTCDYKTNVMGTLNLLGLAKRIGARFLLTSTSEVYGDPLEHPQKETYWGHVNPIGELTFLHWSTHAVVSG